MQAITISTDKGQRIQTTLTDSEAAVICERTGNEFALKLVAEYRKYKNLFPNKRYWLHKLAIEQVEREFEAQRIAMDPNAKPDEPKRTKNLAWRFPKVFEFISRNPKGSVTLQVGNRTVELKVCGPRSKYTGQVQMTDGNRYPNNLYYGRIGKDSVLIASRECTDDIVALLEEFEKNPVEFTSEYGKRTGVCCFCCADLTDEVSVRVGYGPICESRWDLPKHTRYQRKTPKRVSKTEEEEDHRLEYEYEMSEGM